MAANTAIVAKTYHDSQRQRIIKAKLLYPTAAQKTKQLFADNPAFKGFKAIKNAPLQGKNLPLYILVHGTSGNWKNLSWLGNDLVQSGAFVISADYPGYTTGQATPDKVLRMWEQPRDVSFLIDQVLSGKYAQFINKHNITVIGYSLGGYSALALSGARLDINRYQSYCSQNQDASCRYFKKAFKGLSTQDQKMISSNYSDPRVTRTIAITPGFVPAIVPSSFNQLHGHPLVIAAQLDRHVPPKLQLKPYLTQNIQQIHYAEIKGASHFSFMQICKPQAISILAQENAAFVCQEAGPVSRSSIHRKVISIIKKYISTYEHKTLTPPGNNR
ncbi:alpha/beta hydrolase family protein [Celerinatantimonas diazotrophica]|uniref:alpha/beta hydrolase family protein n=1 Tax=Celerinatantimonas diazotrophica TaxID=412034 RepID=UPI001A9D79C4|nr:alpha/beta fold hydrolase [Celerinatantimonas diazotrophica]